MVKNKLRKLLLEAICVEHWARFHFLEDINPEKNEEEQENIIVQIPEILLENCQEEVPHLIPLLNTINQQKINLNSSRDYIFDFLVTIIGKNEDFSNQIEIIVNEEIFSRFLDIFNTFVQEEAEAEENLENSEQEERIVPTFNVWLESFKLWAKERNLDDVLVLID